MIKRFTIIGAAIGAVCGFAAQTALAVIAGPMGGYELVFTFVMACIIATAGAAVGSVAGLLTGVVVSAFSRNKE